MADQRITEEAKKRLDSLFESYSIISDDSYVFLCDMRYDYSRWSKGLVEAFGLPSEYMYAAGEIWEDHVHPEDKKAYHVGVEEIFAGKASGHDMLYRARRPDGGYDICTCRGVVVTDESGNPLYFGGSIRNHSEQSHIDKITGLRNQYGFFADLKNYIRSETPIRMGMVGIARLTEINEIYGYDIGNRVLQNFGRYLMDHVTNRGGVYRMDGSRFAVITTTQNEEAVARMYEKLRAHFRSGIRLDGLDIILELNGGVFSLDDFNVDDQTAYSCLNAAYHESKISKHGDLVSFRNELKSDNRKEIEKLYAVHSSITKGFDGFYLLYQPVVDAATERVIGSEALLRWKNDEYGVVPPDVIIPFLEADPIFPALGEWIMNRALEDAAKLTEYIPDYVMNINLSYSQIERSDFTDMVWQSINNAGVKPEQVCLEMTERCRLLDMELLRNVIVRLRAGGVKIALDDFGTGYSSIGLVKQLPFDTIKIDRGFVQHIEEDEKEKQLLGNFMDMAGIYGAHICVEGIETTGMRDIIRNYGIQSFQGYYYSKPIPIDEILLKVKEGPNCFSQKE